MTSLTGRIHERTELSDDDLAHVHALVAEWSLLADVGFSDLVLWAPTWNDGGFVAIAQVRPTTGSTSMPHDVVEQFAPRGEWPAVDRALVSRAPVLSRNAAAPLIPRDLEAIPVVREGRVLAVVARHASVLTQRVQPVPGTDAEVGLGEVEQVYLQAFDDLADMIARGTFPYAERLGVTTAPPRVGDGLLRVDDSGTVVFSSPNATSAFHRLGLAVDLVGTSLAGTVARLKRRPGPADESLALVAAGDAAGEAEIDNGLAVVTLRGLPLRRHGRAVGALVLVRDITDVRRRDRALLTKDATIREIHHRVKNNLQTVASLLRLQSRRMPEGDARDALDEAVRRVGAIAVVHEVLALAPGQTVDFDDVTDRVVALAADAAAARGGQVRRSGSVGLWPAERSTPLAMALTELLMNAVEHGLDGEAGLVTVTATRTVDEVRLVVSDDGPGFREPTEGGTVGLGLHIVRTLVEEDLGGTLDLGHVGGPGSRVTISVPVE